MNNNNLLGIHAEIEEIGGISFSCIDKKMLKEQEQEHETMIRIRKEINEIQDEGEEDRRIWSNLSILIMGGGMEIPFEIKWSLKLHKLRNEMVKRITTMFSFLKK